MGIICRNVARAAVCLLLRAATQYHCLKTKDGCSTDDLCGWAALISVAGSLMSTGNLILQRCLSRCVSKHAACQAAGANFS